MNFESNRVVIKKKDFPLRKILYKIYGIPVDVMSQLWGIPQEKIIEDAKLGYLRYFDDNPEIIFKDKFYYDYCEAHGKTKSLPQYGYLEQPKASNVYYGYYLKRSPQVNGQLPSYQVFAPDGSIKIFEGQTFEEAFEKAKTYAFEHQYFDDRIPARNLAQVPLTLDELYYFLTLLPKEKFQFTRKKILTAITLIRTRKNRANMSNKRRRKQYD